MPPFMKDMLTLALGQIKEETISSQVRLGVQEAVIKNLKEQQQTLIYLLGGLTIISLIF